MKRLYISLFTLIFNITVYSQNSDYIDSISIRNYYNFQEVISSFALKKFRNATIFYSENSIYSAQIARENDWKQYKIEKIKELVDSLTIKNDSLNWSFGYYYLKFVTNVVIDQTKSHPVASEAGRDYLFVSCTAEDWARFYLSLLFEENKNRLYFTMDLCTKEEGYKTKRGYLKFKMKKGFSKKIYWIK